ncbi:MAG: MaoC family dehydratase N-terminal domain-containing protein [Chloroflexi bacterium]|nr:MaoC family dehydratase N-terminal domain-containing protein [Chloroflexota bacterium]
MTGPWRIPEEARALLGHTAPPEAWPPVTLEQIQRYCYAVDDLNPLYLDPDAAARGPYGGIIAPPLFMGASSIRLAPLSQLGEDGLPINEEDRLRLSLPESQSRLMGTEIELFRPVRPGDALTRRSRLADLFEREGRFGPMLFSVRETRTTDQRDEVVSIERVSVAAMPRGGEAPGFSYAPLSPEECAALLRAPPPGALPRWWDEVQDGEEIPARSRVVTPVQVFLYGAVRGNSHLIHYDKGYAAREGLPERVAQGDLLWALLCQIAAGWMGPMGRLLRFSAQNRGPGFVYEEIMHRGQVTRRWREGEAGLVALDLWSETPGGRPCLRGSATVALPLRP